jgi:hypothetical protein
MAEEAPLGIMNLLTADWGFFTFETELFSLTELPYDYGLMRSESSFWLDSCSISYWPVVMEKPPSLPRLFYLRLPY